MAQAREGVGVVMFSAFVVGFVLAVGFVCGVAAVVLFAIFLISRDDRASQIRDVKEEIA